MAFTILEPTYNCATKQVTFRADGASGVQWLVPAMGLFWVSSPGPYSLDMTNMVDEYIAIVGRDANGNAVSYQWKNYKTVCGSTTTYSSTKEGTASRLFTRTNCPGGVAGYSTYYSSKKTASATSNISQADADQKALAAAQALAQADVDANGQNTINANASLCPLPNPTPTTPSPTTPAPTTPSPTSYSSTRSAIVSKSFTKTNCPAGYQGLSTTYSSTKSATATSSISQADADQKALAAAQALAQADVDANGQNAINANGSLCQATTPSPTPTPPAPSGVPTIYEDCASFTGTLNYTGVASPGSAQSLIYPADPCQSCQVYGCYSPGINRRRRAGERLMGLLILATLALLIYQLFQQK